MPLFAQQPDAVRLRLAQSFEQAGDWERAAVQYEALYQIDPTNYVYFDGLRKSYTNLKEYDKAIDLVRHRLVVQQNDFPLQTILGGLYYQKGNEAAADSIWNAALRTDPRNQTLYRIVASQMIELRIYDKAIETYIKARSATGNERLFAEDLAMLYGALQQYTSATREYIKILTTNPQQLSFVQSRIASFTIRDEGIRAAVTEVKQEVQRSPQNGPLRMLLAWLYIERKDFDAAYEEYRIMDQLNKHGGAEIFNFAQRAMQEQSYKVAAKAFREVIERHPHPSRLPQARFGYARALEELSEGNDTLASTSRQQSSPVSETRSTYAGVIGLYEKLTAEYPKTDIASQAHFRIGVIKRDRFFDLDGARTTFEEVRTMRVNLAHIIDATFAIADIYIAQNDLSRARLELEPFLVQFPQPHRDNALFRVAEIDYFEANMDSALARLGRLTENVGMDLANDALSLLYFIQESQTTSPVALATFARADLLKRQRKYSEALAQFKEIARQYPTALLLDDTMMRIGELHERLGQYQEAVTAFRSVANDIPLGIFRDRAQMRIGEIFERRLNDKTKAIEAYEQLLAKFPTSLQAEEARRRIRLLRGDAI
jgi:tetratricopeptide (TPR) repeat protein